MLSGFHPFAPSFMHLNMAFISWLGWPGYAKGAGFSVLDALAFALYRGSPETPGLFAKSSPKAAIPDER
jgi:hypothetical protein